MTKPEEEPKYTALTPATWFMIVQLLMIHWKIAYNLPIHWWEVFLPSLSLVGLSVLGGILYLIGRGITYSLSKMRRKPLY